MPERTCRKCGKKVEIPKKIEISKGTNDNSPVIKCPYCGAIAGLKVKLRNHRVKGLKNAFL